MKVKYQATDKIEVEIEASNIKEVFETLGPIQEVIGNCRCGKCGGTNIRFIHRKSGKFDYYELLCQTPVQRQGQDGTIIVNKNLSCGAKLSLGSNEAGNLFPRKYEQDPDDKTKPLMKDGKKVWLPNEGWVRWDKTKEKYV